MSFSSAQDVLNMTEPTIASLAKQISQLSEQFTSLLETSNQPQPSLSTYKGNIPETDDFVALRAGLNDAALDLLRLVNGPKNSLRPFFLSHYDLAALQVSLDRRLYDHVPLPTAESTANGEEFGASLTEIAQKAGMDEDRAGRVMGLLATQRIFEQVPGKEKRFKHTAASAFLATDRDYNAMADMQ